MAEKIAPVERATATLRRISPCEHGIAHSLLSVADGVTNFAVPECTDTKGNLRDHYITEAKYPDTERRK